ncbi:MAG: cell division protein FtsQ/DivIB [Thermoleophilia bacterium]
MSRAHGIMAVLWRVAVVVLGIAIVGAVFFWVSQSSLLAIENIQVEGNRAIPTETVMETAGPLLRGQSLAKPSFDDVSRALGVNPYTQSVEVDRDFPHTVRIRIREYRPFADLQAADNKLFVVSAEGRTLAPLTVAGQDHPVLSTKVPCAAQVGSTLDCSDVSTGLWFLENIPVSFNLEFAAVSVADGDIAATTRNGVVIHFGSLDEYSLKFEVIRQLMARAGAAGVNISLDVSVPQRPVTKDVAPAAPAAGAAAQPAAGAQMQ